MSCREYVSDYISRKDEPAAWLEAIKVRFFNDHCVQTCLQKCTADLFDPSSDECLGCLQDNGCFRQKDCFDCAKGFNSANVMESCVEKPIIHSRDQVVAISVSVTFFILLLIYVFRYDRK
jgi:hypothetical protein